VRDEPRPEPLFDLEAVFDVDDYLYFYQESLTDERSDAEVTALVSLLELDRPMKILDLACGYGRHTNRLAALGHTVTGVDITPGFLETARQQAAEMGVQVDYRQDDMRTVDLGEEFDRVLLLFTSFGYFNDAGNLQVLENAARALRPGGLFAMDVPNRDVILKRLQPCRVTEKDGDLMIDRMSLDMHAGLWVNQRILIRDGVRKDKPFAIRVYHATEMRALLEGAGLAVRGVYGGWKAQPLSSESWRMVVVAQKPGEYDEAGGPPDA
jgi:SAM-dependent methyltransferase